MDNGINIDEREAKEIIALRDSFLKLKNNREFKKVVEVGYFKEEAARLVQASVNDELQDEVEQRINLEMIKAIGHLQKYFNAVVLRGNQLEQMLEDYQRELNAKEVETVVDDITGDEYEVEGE